MYTRLMSFLDRVLAADKAKHHTVGSWVFCFFLLLQVSVYVLVPAMPAMKTQTAAATLMLGMLAVAMAATFAAGLWNEYRQLQLNRAAVATGGVATHEVGADDIWATVIGGVPVALPHLVLAVMMLLLYGSTS